MSEPIDRQAAIDAIDVYMKRLCRYIGGPNDTESYAFARGLLVNVEMDINALPPAEPEPKALINLDVMEVSKEAWDKLKNVPVTAFPVQPERKRGKWIDTGCNEEWWAREYRCSECGDTMLGDANFCPNCGADMRGVTE